MIDSGLMATEKNMSTLTSAASMSSLAPTVLLDELLARTSTEPCVLQELLAAAPQEHERMKAQGQGQARRRVAEKRERAREFRDNARYRQVPMPRSRRQTFALTQCGAEIRSVQLREAYDEDGTWRQSTALHCRHDGQPFSGVPVAIPHSFSPLRQAYRVYGTFCGFPCALAFLQQ